MIATTILGNIHEAAGQELMTGRPVDPVVLPSTELTRRINRLRTTNGLELGLRMPAGSADLRDGDLLWLAPGAEGPAVVVQVEATDVLVIAPRSIHEMGVIAHTLGNRHLQAQFPEPTGGQGDAVMLVPYDHTVEDLLVHREIPHIRERRVLDVPFRHAEHTH